MTEFEINIGNENKISFTEVYHEKVLLKHFQGLYSNFDLTISPIASNKVILSSTDSKGKQFLSQIASGIKKYIKIYEENNVSICGLKIETTKDKFHAVDSKPITYEIPIIQALDTIFKRPNTNRTVLEPKLNTNLYCFEHISNKKDYRNLEWDSLSTKQLIRHHKSTKSLNVNGLIKIENSDVDITIESNSNEWNTRLQNRIDLRFQKDKFSHEEMLNYLRILELIVLDEYRTNLNPSGFVLYFERNETKIEWREENKLLTLEWCLRNILKSESTYQIKNEADR